MSDLGTLSNCMMDSDPEANRRARQLRRKSLCISLFFEILLVAAMLVLPLITPGIPSLGPVTILTPVPPFSGVTSSKPVRPQSPPHSSGDRFPFPTNNNLPGHHQNHLNPFGTDAPEVPSPPGETSDGPIGSGPFIPGADGNRIVIPPPVQKPPRKVSIGVMEASLIHRVDPIYPALALATRTSGEVRLSATIGTDGVIKDYRVVSGNPLLVRAAITAIRQWRYRPTQLDGEAVEVETFITVNFILQ
jgi:periplasmic protein TonB